MPAQTPAQPPVGPVIIRLPGAGPVAVGNVVTRLELPNIERAVNAGALNTEIRGAPEQLTRATANVAGGPAAVGNVAVLAGPLGRARVTNVGAPNAVTRAVTQGQVTTVGGIATEQNVRNPLLTRYLSEVYAPVVVQTVGRPTTIVARRTVGNVGTRTIGNVQGGVTISGPQGTVYIPAQELLAAAAG
jgi:hypothetical protein